MGRVSYRAGAKAALLAGVGVMALAGSASCGWAQTAPTSAASADSPTEVVVTAQRRAERLQDVPIAVTAFGAAELQQRGAKNFEDIARTTPGLTLTSGQLGTGGQPTIRGIASSVGAATVGVYIDDTPLQARPTPFAANADPKLFDIQRVEVLRGPQGTLFGASSMGGTIRYITPQPSFSGWNGHFRLEGDAVAGGDADYEAGLAGGGPVNDAIAVRGSAYFRHEGGFIDRDNRTTGAVVQKDVNSSDTTALRGALTWRANDRLSVTPSLYYQKVEFDDLPLFEVGTPTTLGTGPNTTLTSSTSNLRQHNIVSQPGKDEFYLPSLTVQYDLGFATLTSVSSYFYRNDAQRQDYSTVLPNIIFKADYLPGFTDSYIAYSDSTIRQQDATQELRLASKGNGRFRWIVGGFYQRAKEQFLQDVTDQTINSATLAFIHAPVSALFGSPLLSGSRILSRRTTNTGEQYAAFGEATYQVMPKLDVTGGLRVSRVGLDYKNDNIGPVASGAISDAGSQRETPVTPKVSVAYHPDRDAQVYLTVEKGFRSGGVNQTVPQTLCAASLASLGGTTPKAYQSDSLWSYEAGVKSQFAERRVTLNAAAYVIDWDNIQQSLTLPGCGYGYTANLGSARSQGFELEAQVEPVEHLYLGLKTSYTSAKFSQDVLGPPAPGTGAQAVIARSGDRVIGVPDWTVALSLDYSRTLRSGLDGYVRADYQYVGDSRRTLPAGRAGYIASIFNAESYDYSSIRLGLVFDRVWDLSAFLKNIGDNRPLLGASTSASPASGLIRATTLRPRQIGVTLSRSF